MKNNLHFFMRKILFIIPFFLWTCGGGGGGSDDPTDTGSSNIISQTHSIELYDSATFDIIASSTDGNTLSFSISSQPTYGQASILGNTVTYTPQGNYSGNDIMQITASSSTGSTIINIQLDIFNNPYKDYRLSNVQKKAITDIPFNNGTYGTDGACKDCSIGHYCNFGIKIECPSGYVAQEIGLSECIQVNRLERKGSV